MTRVERSIRGHEASYARFHVQFQNREYVYAKLSLFDNSRGDRVLLASSFTIAEEIKGFFNTRLKDESNGLTEFKYNVEIDLRHLILEWKLLNTVKKEGIFSSKKIEIYNASIRSDKRIQVFSGDIEI